MKRISNKHLQLNKMSISKLNTILGGNPTKNTAGNDDDDLPGDTEGVSCTTSRFTVDIASNDNC
ncbi:hypothetical protein [Kordia sp.]|uniref:hypothetical protein n=1 Tax=Kordia sp. TaxID=1965332 RepID=UPI003D6BC78C